MLNAYHLGDDHSEGPVATVEKITISLTPEMAGFVRRVVDAVDY